MYFLLVSDRKKKEKQITVYFQVFTMVSIKITYFSHVALIIYTAFRHIFRAENHFWKNVHANAQMLYICIVK